MPSQNFGYYEEIFFPEDENPWLHSDFFTEIRNLWSKSGGLKGDTSYSKACNLLSPHFSVQIRKDKMIDHFAENVAQQDEDGWINISEEDRLYGLRKSIFKEFDFDESSSEEADSSVVLGIDFRERDEDEVPIEDSFSRSVYITVVATKAFDLKNKIESQNELEKWEEKNNFYLAECFNLEISDEITSYLDEDGDETIGYSSEGGHEGTLVFEKTDTVDLFSERLQSAAFGSSLESHQEDINSEAKEIFKTIYSGDIDNLKKIIPEKFDINKPLGSLGITAPLPLAFSFIFFDDEEVIASLKKTFDADSLKFQERGSIEEVVYFLASKGANLNYQISPGLSYLGISIKFSDELTDFLISYGMDVTAEASDAILFAASNGKLNYVNQFLEAGTDPDFSFSGTSALMYAAQGQDATSKLSLKNQKIQIKIIEALLEKNADINKVDDGGDTALTNAIRSKNHEIVMYLLEKGSNPNSIKGSIAPLKLAKEIKDKVSIKLLTEKGALIEKKIPKKKREITKKNSSKQETKKTKETEKALCPSCNKHFTKKTIYKWGGTCGACYRKDNPHSVTSRSLPVNKGKGFWATLDEIGDSIDDCFEIIKLLSIAGFIIFIFVSILVGIFS
tara:strand:+ start:159 stop:2018 length:1860 start_codon:yes stop_codon:yes gene_type:complete